jgi:hypothetical protein
MYKDKMIRDGTLPKRVRASERTLEIKQELQEMVLEWLEYEEIQDLALYVEENYGQTKLERNQAFWNGLFILNV